MVKKESKEIIKITQIKSAIGYHISQKRTIEALGLKKLNHSVEHSWTPQIEGMIKKVNHLVRVEKI